MIGLGGLDVADPLGVLLITTGQASDGALFNDVWSFDLASDSWQQVEVSGDAPVERYGAA